ncbi:MAG: ATP-grasp domain-containing protein [Micromonosporaceae bacterium]
MTDDVASSLRRMVWVFPDRESTRTVPKWQKAFWFAYQEEAERLGLSWTSHPPDDVAVDCLSRGRPRVYVAGEPVTPENTLFVTSLYSLPYQSMDVFNQYALYAVLEQSGFYLPAPPALSPVVNDKIATILYLKDSPIPAVPTVRIGTGRDLGHRFYEPVLEAMTFPAIVKPVGWCGGWGISMVHNLEDLHGLLSLAQGGETTVAVQPYLGPGTIDFRVFLIDGVPHTVARRTPPTGAYVANYGRGGGIEYIPVPAELTTTLEYVAERVPIPFLCVDFLFDGERYWLSEIEPDGAIVCPDLGNEAAVLRQRSIIQARFRAYQRGHAQWLGHEVKEATDG